MRIIIFTVSLWTFGLFGFQTFSKEPSTQANLQTAQDWYEKSKRSWFPRKFVEILQNYDTAWINSETAKCLSLQKVPVLKDRLILNASCYAQGTDRRLIVELIVFLADRWMKDSRLYEMKEVHKFIGIGNLTKALLDKDVQDLIEPKGEDLIRGDYRLNKDAFRMFLFAGIVRYMTDELFYFRNEALFNFLQKTIFDGKVYSSKLPKEVSRTEHQELLLTLKTLKTQCKNLSGKPKLHLMVAGPAKSGAGKFGHSFLMIKDCLGEPNSYPVFSFAGYVADSSQGTFSLFWQSTFNKLPLILSFSNFKYFHYIYAILENRQIMEYPLNLSDQQFENIERLLIEQHEAFENYWESKEKYGLLFNNCTTKIVEVLRQGFEKSPDSQGKLKASLFAKRIPSSLPEYLSEHKLPLKLLNLENKIVHPNLSVLWEGHQKKILQVIQDAELFLRPKGPSETLWVARLKELEGLADNKVQVRSVAIDRLKQFNQILFEKAMQEKRPLNEFEIRVDLALSALMGYLENDPQEDHRSEALAYLLRHINFARGLD